MRFKDINLGIKLVCSFLAVGIIPLGILGVISLNLSTKALERTAFNQLEAVREIKKFQIESFFQERIGDIKVLANNPFTKNAAKALEQAFNSAGGVQSKRFIGKTGESYDAPESYKKVHDIYFKTFKHYMEQYGYYDIFLLDPEYGDTYFTVTKEADFGQSAQIIDSSLRDVWQAAKNGIITISDMRTYAPSANAPAQFLATPIKENGKTIGILAFQLSIDAINRIMTERSGMGDTGESYLVGQDKLMRSDSYLDPDNHTVTASFADPEKGKVDTQASRDAISGKAGKMSMLDYNNNPVLSAYTPIKVGETVWGLLVEIDQAEAFASIRSIKVDIAIIALIAVVLIVLIAMFMARSIITPIKKGVAMARKMSDGDLTQTLDIDQKDEIGILAQTLNMMSSNLQQMFNDIVTGTQTLNSASIELSAVSGQISSNAETTAQKSTRVTSAAQEMNNNITSVATSTEEITSNIQMIVSATEEMTATIQELSKNTATGNETTSRAVEKAETVLDKVDALGAAAQDINKVSETISEISEQTNLLALNATIEAARAGEAGKGFAVVAGEIKALAQQTAQATKEIGSKVSGVQSTTDDSVKAIKSIVEIITEINSIVSSVAVAIEEQSATTQEIANNVSHAAQRLDSVNDNVNQTSEAAGEVAKDISDVSKATDEMKTGSQHIMTSAGELSKLAAELKEMMDRFKI
ncbi:MAG: methyl-accepting chemotaxis protein [Desulfobacterales bacterium]|nr:methyl-accepting chemotaxis protein [Desulfobacterales bacterium]